MAIRDQTPWIQRIFRRLCGQSAPRAQITHLDQYRPVDVVIDPDSVDEAPGMSSRASEDWHDLVQQGRQVTVSWDGGPQQGSVVARGEIRLIFEDTVWIWLDQELPEASRPATGQALQVLAARTDALRLIPCRLVETSQGGSLQVAISGRISRLQRREDVRMPVDLPPISAVRLSTAGKPMGLLGLRVIDLSAGGIRVQGSEMLRAGERLRIVLRLDDDEPLTPVVEVLVPGYAAQGRFDLMTERDRRRIVQYVYRQEIEARRRRQSAQDDEAVELAD